MSDRRGVGGPPRGTRFRPATYDPSKGEAYRPGSNFEPKNAVKLLAMCEAADISVAGFLNAVVDLIEVDPSTGRPAGWPQAIQLKEAS
ncbi:hypothetical protein OOK31_38530 [Streptomyces sp. NBC_00249]|uniref:hypothetical protein n=1 Tax=Streptomyces sp. NBC_00249 TaxID=2975690 RepID=UPI00225AC7DB|nr:hypothetical protein [Streptomyces sp. NBC_00249]MCX5199709.1 hypothetical protein [Streptomyces sp. NBC_00249]